MAVEKLRLCLIDERRNLTKRASLMEALQSHFDVDLVLADEAVPRSVDDLPRGLGYDAIVFHLKFRRLETIGVFDWNSFSGNRVLLDFDVIQNYSAVAGRKRLGAWIPVIKRFGFDVVICPGRQITERFLDDGIPAVWIPKGYSAEIIRDEERPERRGICYFGRRYPARTAMLIRLEKAEIPVESFECTVAELSDHLNRYEACLVCNMELRWSSRVPPAVVYSSKVMRSPLGRIFRPFPGVEAYEKNFEVAGAGCAPICDWIPELDDHGFVDGESMISYRDFDELVEKLRAYQKERGSFRRIGRAAARLVRNHHTWRHRMPLYEQALRDRVLGVEMAASQRPE